MTPEYLAAIALCVLVVAFLYSAVGHAGASGYIAVMGLFHVAPAEIKPTALVLNILVSCLGSYQFWRAGHFSWKLFWPFAVLSVPLAFLGGYQTLPAHIFKIIVGVVLLLSAARFLLKPSPDREPHQPPLPVAIGVGGGLGLLSGLTGTGGGIFLTPLVIFMNWARTKTASAISALFILVNSIAGFLGSYTKTPSFPSIGIPLAVAAVIGGAAGSYLGSRRFPVTTIKLLLAVVLTIAGLNLTYDGAAELFGWKLKSTTVAAPPAAAEEQHATK